MHRTSLLPFYPHTNTRKIYAAQDVSAVVEGYSNNNISDNCKFTLTIEKENQRWMNDKYFIEFIVLLKLKEHLSQLPSPYKNTDSYVM